MKIFKSLIISSIDIGKCPVSVAVFSFLLMQKTISKKKNNGLIKYIRLLSQAGVFKCVLSRVSRKVTGK